ncbi:chlorophyll synthesis pathway protein BchC [Roseibium sp. FZY0029]|uniref:chlorophyll synthesis pathway protein BchC n=1 Tax=Roseibium sp. FZY0029 TaxID=3116647 RepID=UPI002E9C691A|nr:chlorophyll synthesis pathway protein BchC [Roseibium sp. FZY0029]
MNTTAIVFEKPGSLQVKRLTLTAPDDADVVVETLMSGVSTGTEKMLFDGSMPTFPGMAYPLVPGYESVARIVEAGSQSGQKEGDTVFVPGASCFEGATGLFGATADRLVVPGSRVIPLDENLAEDGVLLALAATAYHAVQRASRPVDLVIGHGVLGRLIARIVCAHGLTPPQVLETSKGRRSGANGYDVLDPSSEAVRRSCNCIIDASGNPAALDPAIARLGKGGVLVLAGFYGKRVGFDFPQAFMREISISLAAEFKPEDTRAVLKLVASGRLSLKGLITHHAPPSDAGSAYRTAFGDPACLKMVIDWRKTA